MSQQQMPSPHLDPTLPLSRDAWWQLTHTLESLLPGPCNDTPAALLAHTNAALAKISDMAPVNNDEADLAAQCVACRAQAEETMRDLRRLDGGDDKRRDQLTRLYVALLRTALSLRRQLHRMQADRRKREADIDAADTDAWTRYIAAREMQQALAQPAGPAPLAPASAPPPPPTPSEHPTSTPHPAPAIRAEAVAAAQPPATASPPLPSRQASHVPTEETPRDLEQEVEYDAAVYPRRVRQIRQCGGVPPDWAFGPPDDVLLEALLASRSPTLLAIDTDRRTE